MKNRMLSLISSKYLKIKYRLVEEMNYCVYFITDGDYIKIGVAASLPNRIKQLQTGNPRKLKAIYVIEAKNQRDALKMEADFHNYFKDKKCIGEWFLISKDEIQHASKILGYEIMFPSSKFDFEVDGIVMV